MLPAFHQIHFPHQSDQTGPPPGAGTGAADVSRYNPPVTSAATSMAASPPVYFGYSSANGHHPMRSNDQFQYQPYATPQSTHTAAPSGNGREGITRPTASSLPTMPGLIWQGKRGKDNDYLTTNTTPTGMIANGGMPTVQPMMANRGYISFTGSNLQTVSAVPRGQVSNPSTSQSYAATTSIPTGYPAIAATMTPNSIFSSNK